MNPLNPIMAVLVAASVGVMPLQALAADGTSATDEKNPVNALTKLVAEKPAVRKDAGARFEDFLVNPDADGKSFLAAGADRPTLGKVAKAWAEKAAAADVAMLYFVAGPGAGEMPSWAKQDALLSKTFKPGMKWEGRLRVALADWTDKYQIAKTGAAAEVEAFFNVAAQKAGTVFRDPRTPGELEESLAANDTTGVKVPIPSKPGGGGVTAPSQMYGLEDLYVNGAEVQEVHGPADEGGRRISVKIYTSRNDKGELINQIGVFDITDPNNIYGQRFPMSVGKHEFALDDRTPGHKKYQLVVETKPDGTRGIFFGRPDSKAGEPGTLNTSVEGLLLARADQAAAIGNIVKVGDQEFYAVPQGGKRGALAFLPKSLVDERDKSNASKLVPELYAEVSARDSNGNTANIKGKPHLGGLGDKEYHLEFDKASGLWVVKDGAGDKPEPPKPPTKPDGTPDPGGDTPTTPGTGNSLAEMEALMLQQGWLKDEKDNADLDAGMKAKHRILYRNDPVTGLEYSVLVPLDVAEGGQLVYRSILKNEDGTVRNPPLMLKRVTGWKKYLILEFDGQQQYLDLTKPDKANGYTTVGFLHKESGSVAARKFSSAEAMVDGLRRFSTIADADKPALVEIPKRVAARAKTGAYNVEAFFTAKGLVAQLLHNAKMAQVWPGDGESGVPDPDPSYAGLNGTANVFEQATSSDDAPLLESFSSDITKDVTAVGAVQKDIALYVTKPPAGSAAEPKRYYLIFRFRAKEKDEVKTFRVKPFELFSEEKGRNPLPEKYEMAGLVEAGEVVENRLDMGYGFVKGSSKTRGAFVVYQNKQLVEGGARKSGANCVGPLVWWGVADRDAAVKACKADKFE